MAKEKRLIDTDALIKSMREEDLLFPDIPWSTTGVQKQIDKLPTVDAVEVVRSRTLWCDYGDYRENAHHRSNSRGAWAVGCRSVIRHDDRKSIQM